MPTWKDANQILLNSPAIPELLLKAAKSKRALRKSE